MLPKCFVRSVWLFFGNRRPPNGTYKVFWELGSSKSILYVTFGGFLLRRPATEEVGKRYVQSTLGATMLPKCFVRSVW